MKRDFLNTLNALEQSLQQLYQSIGYSSDRIKPLPDDLIIRIKSIINNGKINRYVLSLNQQINDATSRMKEHTASVANDIRIDKEPLTANNQNSSEKPLEKDDHDDNVMPSFICGLISVCDNLLIKRNYLLDNGETEIGNAIRVVDSVLKETEALLLKNGAEVIKDSEIFSDVNQFASGTRETDDDSLVGHIAEVIRPGYRYHNTVIRPEEVIVYIKKE